MRVHDEWIDLRADFSGDARKLLFEQYKIYVETSSQVSDRRGAANTFLMSVNAALVSVYGLIAGKDASLGTATGLWSWLMPLVGVTLCLGWVIMIRSYRALNRAKFAVIAEIEKRLPAQLFACEWRHLERGRSWLYPQLTWVEQVVPGVFATIYLVLGATSLIR